MHFDNDDVSLSEDLSLDAENFEIYDDELGELLEDEDTDESLENPDFVKDAIASLWTVQDLIRWIYSYMSRKDVYFGHGFDNAWDEARALVLNQLHLPYDTDQVYLLNSKVTDFEKKRIISLVYDRVHKRIPLSYLINSARFLNRDYYIDKRVIIPRSPIGELIQNGFLGLLHAAPENILDLCCGSGVLAFAMAEKFPDSQVDAIDISSDALDVANINLEFLDNPQISNRMAFMESDLFEAVPENIKYDLIVSNPPYVDQYDLETMPAEFHHEPGISLGSGEDGLLLTSRILAEAPNYLNPEGVLIVEVGNSRYALERALPKVPFNWVQLKNGGHGVFAITKEQLEAHQDAINIFYQSKLDVEETQEASSQESSAGEAQEQNETESTEKTE